MEYLENHHTNSSEAVQENQEAEVVENVHAHDLILHVTTKEAWERSKILGFYRHKSLSLEGFIHCCYLDQLNAIIHRHFKGKHKNLVVLGLEKKLIQAELKEEKSSYDVELKDAGANKIAIIKAIKEVLALGLAEAKGLVDSAPSMLKAGMKKEEAEALKKKIEDAGGKVELK